jgi:hypothetical protein
MTTKKNSINIDIKFISDKIDKYIEEFYTDPVTIVSDIQNDKVEIVDALIRSSVSKKTVQYEIKKYNKIIVSDINDGHGCVKKEHKIKKQIGKDRFGFKIFVTKQNNLMILQKLNSYEKNSIINTYDQRIKSYETLYKNNLCPKLIDHYICSNDKYNSVYMVIIMEFPKDFVLLSEYLQKSKTTSKDIDEIREKIYDVSVSLTKKNIMLDEYFEKDDLLVSKSKDILFIRVEKISNLNETIDNNLKKIRRNLQWIVKKTEDSRVDSDDNVTNYVAKRLLEDNVFKIDL